MNEGEFQIEKLKVLLDAYVQLMRLHCEPGEKAHALWDGIRFIKERIRKATT